MPILAFTFAAISLYIGATNLVYPAILRLGPDGMHFHHWRMAWFVAWADTADVRLATIGINGLPMTANVILRQRDGSDSRISSALTISQGRLAELIRLRWKMT